MYKIILIPVSVLVFSMSGPVVSKAFSAEGGAIFSSLHCDSCHKPDKKTAAIPLMDIAKAYGGDREKLVKFFKGRNKAVIETDKPGIMKGQLVKLKALAEEDQRALADYILSFK